MTEADQVWLQISAGRGPQECQLAVALLVRHFDGEATALGLSYQVLDAVPGDGREALLSALVSIGGRGASVFAERNAGSVLWVAPSPVRPNHKRKNWFVSVEPLSPLTQGGGAALLPADVTFEAIRASGPGGQHVNKTESAVRATHRPSGIVVVAREERSQAMNRKLALARIAGRLAAQQQAAAAGVEHQRWAQHDALERGQPVRTFVGPEFRER